MRKIAIGRVIGLGVFAVSILAAVFLSVRSYQISQSFSRCLDEEMTRGEVDLSRPSAVTLPYTKSCELGCIDVVILSIESGANIENQEVLSLSGLDGQFRVFDREGTLIRVFNLEQLTEPALVRDEGITLGYLLDPVPVGEYQATIEVKSGAKELSGVSQTILAKPVLRCGVPLIAATHAQLMAVLLGVVGLIVGAFVGPGIVQDGLRKEIATSAGVPLQ